MNDDLSQVRLLLVDDAADARETLGQLLTMNGYCVQGARDGLEALELARSFAPHCVLIDIRMPGLDGLGLARELRSAYGNDLVLIAISGHDPDADARVAEAFDMADYWLAKPVDPKRLTQVLPPTSAAVRAPVV